MSKKLYQQLIQQQLQYHPVYRSWVSNHLPMVLTALHHMAATDQQLQQFYDKSAEFLEPTIQPTTTVTIETLNDNLGNITSYHDYYDYFLQRLQRESAQQVIKETTQQLLPGISTSAFHGVIRLSYAIETKQITEIATALAFWSSYYYDLNTTVVTQPVSIAESLFAAEKQLKDLQIETVNISDRVQYVDQQLKHIIYPENLQWAQLIEFLAYCYYQADDFTVLHAFTSTQALHNISMWTKTEFSLTHLWQAIVLSLLTTGKPMAQLLQQPVIDQTVKQDWKTLLKQACTALNDAHAIKLTYTCWQLNKELNRPIFYYCAKKKINAALI